MPHSSLLLKAGSDLLPQNMYIYLMLGQNMDIHFLDWYNYAQMGFLFFLSVFSVSYTTFV